MARVTDDLLDHTRLELGTAEAQLGPTRVRDLVDDIIELARAAAGDRPLTVSAHVEADVPAVVTTDGSRAHQLIWNLAENAVKLLTEGVEDLFGATFAVEPDPERAAVLIRRHIEDRRKKLGLPSAKV